MTGHAAFRPSLHRYALAVAIATGALVFVGGLVTSTGSALAVPDWPLSFGTLFPRMTGGVLFEHGHRMLAGTVGLLTIGLAAWVWRVEARGWVRWLGVAAAVAVLLQAVLGGLTVLLRLPVAIAVSHAGLAQIFFCLNVTLALVTSRGWLEAAPPVAERGRPSLRVLSAVTVVVVYLQVLLGALVRHTGAGLAIPDFPLAFGRLWPPAAAITPLVTFQLAHRLGAVVVTALVLWTVVAALRRHGGVAPLRRPALLLVLLLAWQIWLGAAIILTRRAVVPTTTHVVSGALVLATSLVLALRARRLLGAAATAPVERAETSRSPAAA
jgi:cytochrome c oxidase assembly protein subunit 15